MNSHKNGESLNAIISEEKTLIFIHAMTIENVNVSKDSWERKQKNHETVICNLVIRFAPQEAKMVSNSYK